MLSVCPRRCTGAGNGSYQSGDLGVFRAERAGKGQHMKEWQIQAGTLRGVFGPVEWSDWEPVFALTQSHALYLAYHRWPYADHFKAHRKGDLPPYVV